MFVNLHAKDWADPGQARAQPVVKGRPAMNPKYLLPSARRPQVLGLLQQECSIKSRWSASADVPTPGNSNCSR